MIWNPDCEDPTSCDCPGEERADTECEPSLLCRLLEWVESLVERLVPAPSPGPKCPCPRVIGTLPSGRVSYVSVRRDPSCPRHGDQTSQDIGWPQ